MSRKMKRLRHLLPSHLQRQLQPRPRQGRNVFPDRHLLLRLPNAYKQAFFPGCKYGSLCDQATTMEEAREIADTLVDNSTVILNLEGIDVELAQRIIDFTSGACYSLGGSLQQVSSYIFVLGPYNVDITGDLQNILGGSVPSVRVGY